MTHIVSLFCLITEGRKICNDKNMNHGRRKTHLSLDAHQFTTRLWMASVTHFIINEFSQPQIPTDSNLFVIMYIIAKCFQLPA